MRRQGKSSPSVSGQVPGTSEQLSPGRGNFTANSMRGVALREMSYTSRQTRQEASAAVRDPDQPSMDGH